MTTRLIGLALASSLIASACSGSGGSSPGMSTMSGTLMDAPFRTSAGDVTAVNIKIAKFEVVGSSAGIQTVATFTPSMSVNLLNYQTTGLTLGTGQIHAHGR